MPSLGVRSPWCHVFTQSGSMKKKALPERVSECIMLEIHDLSLEIQIDIATMYNKVQLPILNRPQEFE